MRYFIFISFLLILDSCSVRTISSKSEDMTFIRGNKKIIVAFVSENKFFDHDKPTIISVKGVNIEVKNLGFSAPIGFKLIKEDYLNNIYYLEFYQMKNYNMTEKFNFGISFKEGKKTINHIFLIPYN